MKKFIVEKSRTTLWREAQSKGLRLSVIGRARRIGEVRVRVRIRRFVTIGGADISETADPTSARRPAPPITGTSK